MSSVARQGELVVLPRVEVGELGDPVQHVGDQLAEEDPRRDADLAAQLPRDGAGQVGDVGVVDQARDPVLRHASRDAYRSRIAMPSLAELGQVEAGQPELNGARRVEPGVGAEVGGQPLGERRQPGDALRPVVEGGRPGDQQVQAGEPAGVHVVDELPQRVEALVAHVGADPLEGLDLVEDDQQPGMAGVAQDRQQSLQEAERGEVVEVALDACGAAGGGSDVGLAADPGEQALRGGQVPVQAAFR